MAIIKHPTTQFTNKGKAIDIVSSLNNDPDDTWAYKLIQDTNDLGVFYIGIYDDDNTFVGYL